MWWNLNTQLTFSQWYICRKRKCIFIRHISMFVERLQVWRVIHQHPQIVLCRAVSQSVHPPASTNTALTQVQHLPLGLVEPREIPLGPLLELVWVSLDDIPAFMCVNCTIQHDVIHDFAEDELSPFIYVAN